MSINLTPPPKRRLAVVQQYPGTGKSYATAGHLAAVARSEDGRIVYSAPSHRVGEDMERMLAARGVDPERVVHRYSVLSDRPGVEPCARREEVSTAIAVGGGLRPRKVCASCPLRETCAALAAAVADDRRAKEARVEIVAHPALAGGESSDVATIVDEPPGYLEEIDLSGEALARLRAATVAAGAMATAFRAARVIAKGWRRGLRDDSAVVTTVAGEAEDEERDVTLGEWLRGQDPSAVDVVNAHEIEFATRNGEMLRTIRDVIRVELWDRRLGRPARRATAVTEPVPTAAISTMHARGAVLLDATPWRPVLAQFFDEVEYRETPEPQTEGVVREVRAVSWSGQTNLLCRGWYLPFNPRWNHLENEVRLTAAEHPGARRTLLVTFKAIGDALRSGDGPEYLRGRLADGTLELAHFGAVRSRNDWAEVDVVLVIGTPRFHSKGVALAAGLDEEEADAASLEFARGEILQAVERGRSVRRTAATPLAQVVVCAPGAEPPGWPVLSADDRALRARRWFTEAEAASGRDAAMEAAGLATDRQRKSARGGANNLSDRDGWLVVAKVATAPSPESVSEIARFRTWVERTTWKKGMPVSRATLYRIKADPLRPVGEEMLAYFRGL